MDLSKDVIISGGENASSLAIQQEEHYARAPALDVYVWPSRADVLEISVIARSHPKWGERPMTFVILHSQNAGATARRT